MSRRSKTPNKTERTAQPLATTATTTAPRRGSFILRALQDRRTQQLLIALIAVLLSLVAISVVILAVGKNPLQVFHGLVQGSGILPKPRYAGGKGMITDFLGLLDAMTPMLFAALAVAIAFKAGLFNIGVSGQMLCAGFLATVLIGYSGLGAVLAKPLVLLVGLVVGALLGAFVGLLKARWNIHEVVSTIMLNYIIQYIVSFFIKSYYIDPVSRQSRAITADARLTLMNVPLGDMTSRIPIMIILAVIVAVLLYLLLMKTRLGFEIRSVGTNRKAAQYSGIRSSRIIVVAMILSGACAGLAGVTYYLGYFNTIEPGTLTSVGFDSIAVALLGNSNPVACILSSFLISILTFGSTYMSSTAGISEYIASLIVGIVLLFCACGGFIQYLINKRNLQALEPEKLSIGALNAVAVGVVAATDTRSGQSEDVEDVRQVGLAKAASLSPPGAIERDVGDADDRIVDTARAPHRKDSPDARSKEAGDDL